jgi:hypothetical protein
MGVSKIGLLILAFGIVACSGRRNKEAEKAPPQAPIARNIFPENSIGVVYLDTTHNGNYSLTIRFPYFELSDGLLNRDSTNYVKDVPLNIEPQTIILFDEAGELTTIENASNCISKFWCENDGGIQYEPTYVVAIKQNKFRRPLQIKNSKILGNLSCFAIINYNAPHFKSFYPASGSENKNVVMRGRLSSDYSGYAYRVPEIYGYYDRNVQLVADPDDVGMAAYCITLQAFNTRQEFELGCCGP